MIFICSWYYHWCELLHKIQKKTYQGKPNAIKCFKLQFIIESSQEVETNGFFQLTPDGQHVLMVENVSKLTPGYAFCDINICESKVCHLFFVASLNW